jgi:hypothetical protein
VASHRLINASMSNSFLRTVINARGVTNMLISPVFNAVRA